MTTLKYVARSRFSTQIDAVEVEKETAESVWVKGRRKAKMSDGNNYFDTWQEAHDFLLCDADFRLRKAKYLLDKERSRLEMIKKMNRPSQERNP